MMEVRSSVLVGEPVARCCCNCKLLPPSLQSANEFQASHHDFQGCFAEVATTTSTGCGHFPAPVFLFLEEGIVHDLPKEPTKLNWGCVKTVRQGTFGTAPMRSVVRRIAGDRVSREGVQ